MEAYEELDGLDLIGVTPPPTSGRQKQIAQRAQAVAKNAAAMAGKLSRTKSKRKRSGTSRAIAKLKSASSQLQKLAGTVANAPAAAPKPKAKPAAKSAPISRTKSSVAAPRATTTPQRASVARTIPRAPARAQVRRSAIGAQPIPPGNLQQPPGGGSTTGGGMGAALDQIVANIDAYTAALDQITQMGGVYTAIVVAEDQVTDQTQLGAGDAILDQMDSVFGSFPDDPGNSSDVAAATSAASGAGQLISQGNTWLQSATGKTVVSTVQNTDGTTDTTYSDGSVTHVDANGNPTTSPPGTVAPGSVPPGAPPGTPPVGTPGASGKIGPAPTITALSSTSAAPGDIITISGTNLSTVSKIDIAGMNAPDFSLDAPTQISLMVPQGARSGVLRVTGPGGAATSMLQVAAPYADPNAQQGGGFGGGGGGGGYDGGGGGYDGGGGGYAPPQQEYADDGGYGVVPSDGSGADFTDQEVSTEDAESAANEAIDALLSGGEEDDDLEEDSGLDEMGADLIGAVAKGEEWDNAKDYWPGNIVWYAGKFWRAAKPISAPWFPMLQSGEEPGASSSWVSAGDVVIGIQDLGAARKQMDSLKQVPVGVARIFVDRGLVSINQAFANASGVFSNLPGEAERKDVLGHIQWHQTNLAKYTDTTAIYPDGPDLKEWVLRAFVEQNASEEGANAGIAGKAWSDYADMWISAGQFIASLPPKALEGIKDSAIAIRKMAASAAGGFVEDVTGLPLWAWGLLSVGVVGVLGLVAWAILNSKAGVAVAGVAASRYLPGRG